MLPTYREVGPLNACLLDSCHEICGLDDVVDKAAKSLAASKPLVITGFLSTSQLPVPGSQRSAVHGSLSAQFFASPWQLPSASQLSYVVHLLLSSQKAPTLGSLVHWPFALSQESNVQLLLSWQSDALLQQDLPVVVPKISMSST